MLAEDVENRLRNVLERVDDAWKTRDDLLRDILNAVERISDKSVNADAHPCCGQPVTLRDVMALVDDSWVSVDGVTFYKKGVVPPKVARLMDLEVESVSPAAMLAIELAEHSVEV